MVTSRWTRRKLLNAGGLAAVGAASGGFNWAAPGGVGLPPAEAAAGGPVRGGTLKVAQIGDPPALDIHATTATITTDNMVSVYESLFALDASGNAQPLLATAARWSNGNLTLTLPLRTDVLFHNGLPMTAEDVVASVQRWSRLAVLGQLAAKAIKDVVATDARTVTINLTRPFGLLPVYLASPNNMAAIMPKSVLDKYGDKPAQEWIGTGPYRFQEWRPDAYVRLVRWDKYVPVNTAASGYAGRRTAYVDQIEIIPVPDANTRLAGMKSGEYHLAYSIPNDQFSLVKSTPGLTPELLKPDSWFIFNLNKKSRMFTNKQMRQAFMKAINNKPIMQAAFGPQEFWSIASPTIGYLTYTDNKDGADVFNHQDSAGARALLKEAGYNGTPLVWLTTQNYDWMYKGALVARSQLEAAGFKVDLQVMDWATLVQRRAQAEIYDVFQTGVGGAPAIPPAMDAFVSPLWPGWWSNPKKDAAMQKFEGSVDLKARQAAWFEVQRLFYEDAAAVKVGDFYSYYVRQNNVQGFLPLPYPPYWNVWLAR